MMGTWPDYGIENTGISPLAQVVIPLCMAIALALFAGIYISCTIGSRRHDYPENPIRMIMGLTSPTTSHHRVSSGVARDQIQGAQTIETPAYLGALEAMLALKFTKTESKIALDQAISEGTDQNDSGELLSKAVRLVR